MKYQLSLAVKLPINTEGELNKFCKENNTNHKDDIWYDDHVNTCLFFDIIPDLHCDVTTKAEIIIAKFLGDDPELCWGVYDSEGFCIVTEENFL